MARKPILPGERDTDHLAAGSCNGCANDRSPGGVSAGQGGADDGNRTR